MNYRYADENDCALILSFIRALAVYEKMEDEVIATEDLMREWIFEKGKAEVLFALDWPRNTLYSRIDARVEEMVRCGLVDEVKALMADEGSHPTAIQAIGYKEIVEALTGETSMERAIWRTKQATRYLAKRQLTWFRRDERIRWFDCENYEDAYREIERYVKETIYDRRV